MESLWTWVDGTLMHALVSPSAAVDAPPLVLVHGVIASSDYLAPTAELLAPDFLVYLPDLPGYGRSKPSTRRMDVPGLADALVAWMDAVGLPQANFLGNSFGCQILADLMLRYPERAEGSIWIGPTVDDHARCLPRQALRLAIDGPRERLSLWPLLLRSLWRMGVPRAAAAVRAMMEDRIEEKLGGIAAPVLVLRGEHDPVATQRWVEEVTRRLPHACCETIPGAAHAANYSAPEQVAAATRAFLQAAES
jgi:pimeloyl-ACP methyl ester carboxylesterase